MTPDEVTADALLHLVEAIRQRDSRYSPLAAGIVAALSAGVASDSRSFSRIFGIAHALVLREINLMDGPEAPIRILSRDPRTQRTHLCLSENGAALMALVR